MARGDAAACITPRLPDFALGAREHPFSRLISKLAHHERGVIRPLVVGNARARPVALTTSRPCAAAGALAGSTR